MAEHKKMSKEDFVKQYYVEIANKKKEKEILEDSKLRKNIQAYIRQLCTLTRNGNTILDDVHNRFADSKYDKYRQYFKTWVTDVLEKMEREESVR